MVTYKPLAIDLFCGAGGISEGILQAGFHIIYSNEINKDAALTYQKRHEQLGLIHGLNTFLDVIDIRNVTGKNIYKKINSLKATNTSITRIDAIFGGPPCQGFSRAGRQQSNDERNTLFREYLRIVSEIKPNYVVFENVLGILDVQLNDFKSQVDNEIYNGVNALEIISKELNKLGLVTLNYQILNAVHYGVPQNRKRVIIMAYKEGLTPPVYPEKNVNEVITVKDALEDIYSFELSSNYQLESIRGRTRHIVTNEPILSSQLFNIETTKHSAIVKERFSLLKPGENLNQLRARIKRDGINLEGYHHLLIRLSENLEMNKKQIIDLYKRKGICDEYLTYLLTKKSAQIKLNPYEPSCTVMTLPDDIISPFNDRIFSVRELARLQSFDDSFIFYGRRTTGSSNRRHEVPQYSQVGNAVPPLLAKAIGKQIMNAITLNNTQN